MVGAFQSWKISSWFPEQRANNKERPYKIHTLLVQINHWPLSRYYYDKPFVVWTGKGYPSSIIWTELNRRLVLGNSSSTPASASESFSSWPCLQWAVGEVSPPGCLGGFDIRLNTFSLTSSLSEKLPEKTVFWNAQFKSTIMLSLLSSYIYTSTDRTDIDTQT